jgi:ferric-dicitrate binding protein FerR (iron transport regulator)
MKNLNNILKWLNDEMTPEEFQAFKETDDYNLYKDIAEKAKNINLLSLNTDIAYKDFKLRIEKKKKNKTKVFSLNNSLFKIAAAVIVFFGLTYFLFNFNQTSIKSGYTENKTYVLPDNSTVTLNAVSEINYNKFSFIKKRSLKLSGEALFKVQKGSSFNVSTSKGSIKVLGTKFNVKSRKNTFNVFCYEGKVSVTIKNKVIILAKGEGLQLNQNNTITKYTDNTISSPSWTNHISTFKEEPYSEVLAEFERQFNVKITTNNIDTKILFSGGFDNTDINSAIKSISLPLNINYTINRKDGKIELFK